MSNYGFYEWWTRFLRHLHAACIWRNPANKIHWPPWRHFDWKQHVFVSIDICIWNSRLLGFLTLLSTSFCVKCIWWHPATDLHDIRDVILSEWEWRHRRHGCQWLDVIGYILHKKWRRNWAQQPWKPIIPYTYLNPYKNMLLSVKMTSWRSCRLVDFIGWILWNTCCVEKNVKIELSIHKTHN